ncbi:MAG: CCA tRNA nucleotidyltransferase [Eubacteriales bacterium]
MKIQIPEYVKAALETIHRHGFEGYIVGGCVRDALIRVETNDYDITTDALPDTIITLFKDYRIVDNGIKHGTVTVVIDHHNVEITTYRIEGSYSDKRRPDEVFYTGHLIADLSRRDFTMNAIAYNEAEGFLDYFNGMKDIENRLIQCVGNPHERFNEDALRMLRALRFSSTLGFDIEEETKKSIHENKRWIRDISIERINWEFSKMLCGKYIDIILSNFSDVLQTIIPELEVHGNDLTVFNMPPVLHLRLAALLYNFPAFNDEKEGYSCSASDLVEKILSRLRFNKDIIKKVVTLIRYKNMSLDMNDTTIKEQMNQLTPDTLKDLLRLKKGEILFRDKGNQEIVHNVDRINQKIDSILSQGDCFSLDHLAVTGDHLLDLGLPQDKSMGKILDTLLQKVISGELSNDRMSLLSYVQQDQYYMPPEWEAHQRTFISWPVREAMIWQENYKEVCQTYAQVAKVISQFEPVTIIVNTNQYGEAEMFCGKKVRLLEIPHNDAWVRDNGPTFVRKQEQLAGINWKFNAWGEKYIPYDLDDQVARRILDQYNVAAVDVPVVLEGGSIHVDGEGTLLTTEECLLNKNRNPRLSREQIEGYMKRYLGISSIIWLKRGLYGDETDGHIDNIACFAKPGMILIQVCRDPGDPNYEIAMEGLEILRKVKDALGRTLKIVQIPQPPERYYRNRRLTLSYMNFYFVNNGIILPVFGGDAEKTDIRAKRILQEVFPDRRIVTVDGMGLIAEGGNVHCITQQMPRLRG